MPIRNGKTVDWKHHVPGFRRILRSEVDVKSKFESIAELVDRKKDLFGKGLADFAEDMRGTIEDCEGLPPDDLANSCDYVLEEIYDYADYHLIWLGS